MTDSALVIVDLQNDFLAGGALAVPEGDQVIPLINQLQTRFDLVVATQDWHPPNHSSFAANHPGQKPGDVVDLYGLPQILWPTHCVQDTLGADFAPTLDRRQIQHVFHKGIDPAIDSYSAFFDNAHRRSTGLADFLLERGVRDLFLAGLATDYCVKFSALDARQLRFNTYVIEDACRGIELHSGDIASTLHDLRHDGIHVVLSRDL
jgi:nicotinamidase/pyrazinamidase